MILEKILEGLSWGLFGVSALIPLCAFSVAWSYLGPILRKSKDDRIELLDDLFEEDTDEAEPELPTPEIHKPYRFTASTIVRPPNIVRREDSENED